MASHSKHLMATISAKDKKIKELEEENSRLRTALRILAAPKDEYFVAQPFRFLDLPSELRITIYELCLVKGTVYPMPRPRYDHRYDSIERFANPEWALLAVNRQIRIEASEILLKQNHFVISYDYDGMDNIWVEEPDTVCDREPMSLPSLARRNLKSVSITFDTRGITVDAMKVADCFAGFGTAITEDLERIQAAHEGIEDCCEVWEDMATTFDSAEFLQIDISNAYCPLGCHRYIELAAYAIQEAVVSNSRLQTLEILGTKTSDERAAIKKSIVKNLTTMPPGRCALRILRFKSLNCGDPRGPVFNSCLGLHSNGFEDAMEDVEIDIVQLAPPPKKVRNTRKVNEDRERRLKR